MPSVQPILWGRLQAWASKVAELCPREQLQEHGLLDICEEVGACCQASWERACWWQSVQGQQQSCMAWRSTQAAAPARQQVPGAVQWLAVRVLVVAASTWWRACCARQGLGRVV